MTESEERQIPVISSFKRNHQNVHSRKTRNRVPPLTGIRPRKDSLPAENINLPAAPPFIWRKLSEHNLSGCRLPALREKKFIEKGQNGDAVGVSERKIAAALWHLQLLEGSQSFREILDRRRTETSRFEAEVKQSQAHIHKLETQHRSSSKKLKSFLRKLAEEKASWYRKEQEKLRAVIDGVKNDLNKERKNYERLEFMNRKLVGDLAEAKLRTKRFLQDYKKERKAREILEEVCNELANEIAEDKAEVEALKWESIDIHDEVEEERKMLQLAEVWREERVQMKLKGAKLVLEEKYSELSRLIADVGTFLRSRSHAMDVVEMRNAELLKEVVSSVVIKDVKEFGYQPRMTLDDIVTVFEDLHSDEANERDIEPCYGYTFGSVSSKIHTENPEN